MIGDVGIVNPRNGRFDFFFNITLPKEHPLNYTSVPVPPDFEPFPLDLSEDTEHTILPNDPIVRGTLVCVADKYHHVIQLT